MVPHVFNQVGLMSLFIYIHVKWLSSLFRGSPEGVWIVTGRKELYPNFLLKRVILVSFKQIEQDLSLKCSALKGFIPHLQWESPSPNQIMGLKNILVRKKLWTRKNFWSTKQFCSKIFWLKKIVGQKKKFEKNCGYKKMFEKNCGYKKFLDLKKFWVWKKVFEKKLWVKKFWV